MNEDEKKQKDAEKRAFELVDPRKADQFGENEFIEFKELWSLVDKELRGDLAIQLLEKLNFPRKAAMIPKENANVRTSSLYQDFVMRSILNRSADVCNRKFDEFESVGKLVSYLQRALKSTFLNKLGRVVATLDAFDPNSKEEQTFDVPIQSDDSLQIEFDELRKTATKVLKNLLANYDDAQERYDLLYARAVEGKKFDVIAQEFNKRDNVELTTSAYQKKFAALVQDLKTSGQLEQLKEELDQLNDQMSKFSARFKKPSDQPDN